MEGRYHDFTLAEAMEIAKRNDPGEKVPSVSRTLIAEIENLRKDAERWRELVETWGGMQQRVGHREIGISTPRWRVPDEVTSFGEAFDRRYELDEASEQGANA